MIKALFQLTLFALLFVGCLQKEPIVPKTLTDIEPFLKNSPILLKENQQKLYTDFLLHYYMPWQNKKIDATYKDTTWAIRLYSAKKLYAENRLPLPANHLKRWIENANYKSFNSLKRYAVVVHPSNLRVFPTNRHISRL